MLIVRNNYKLHLVFVQQVIHEKGDNVNFVFDFGPFLTHRHLITTIIMQMVPSTIKFPSFHIKREPLPLPEWYIQFLAVLRRSAKNLVQCFSSIKFDALYFTR